MRSVSDLLAEIDGLRQENERLRDELAYYKDREAECPFAQANLGVCH